MQFPLDFFYTTATTTFSSNGWFVVDSKPAAGSPEDDLLALQRRIDEERAQALQGCFMRFAGQLSEAEIAKLLQPDAPVPVEEPINSQDPRGEGKWNARRRQPAPAQSITAADLRPDEEDN